MGVWGGARQQLLVSEASGWERKAATSSAAQRLAQPLKPSPTPPPRAAATAGSPPALQNMMGRTAYAPSKAAVYNIKSFSVAPVGSIQECYIPMDVDGCFGPDAPLDEQLIYWWDFGGWC